MEIRLINKSNIEECAKLLMEAYNCPPWNTQWTFETAVRYLKEFEEARRFVGFALYVEGHIVAAMFGHEKAWYTNDELFIDEFFVVPEKQRMGYGRFLLEHAEKYVKENELAGITLLTNRYMPSVSFYEKNNFEKAEHVLFMYKVL